MIEGRAITAIKASSVLVSFSCVTIIFLPIGGVFGIFQGFFGLLVCLEGYFAVLEVNLPRLVFYMIGMLLYAAFSMVMTALALVSPCSLDEKCCYYNIIDELTRQLLKDTCTNSYVQYGYSLLLAGVGLPMTSLLLITLPAYKDLKKKVKAAKTEKNNVDKFLYAS